MQRAGVPADEEPAAHYDGAQLGKIQLTAIDDPPRRLGAEHLTGRGGDRDRAAARSDGPELSTSRRFGRRGGQPGDQADEGRLRPAAERVTGADMNDDDRRVSLDARRRQLGGRARLGGRVRGHAHRVLRRIRRHGRPSVDGLEQVPLVQHRMPRVQPPRPMNPASVEPAPTLNIVADPGRSGGGQRQPGAARPTVKVQYEIESRPPQPQRQPGIVAQPPPAAALVDDDQLVDVRVGGDDRFGRALHQIREVGSRECALQRAEKRGREDDVADQAEPDEENPRRRRRHRPGGYGSIVASSISITGMSSLTGYTRLH